MVVSSLVARFLYSVIICRYDSLKVNVIINSIDSLRWLAIIRSDGSLLSLVIILLRDSLSAFAIIKKIYKIQNDVSISSRDSL